jgi:hypothetical protein
MKKVVKRDVNTGEDNRSSELTIAAVHESIRQSQMTGDKEGSKNTKSKENSWQL